MASSIGNTKDCTLKARQFFCRICGNDWMSHLTVERDHGLCQVCDHFLYGDIFGPIKPDLDQVSYLRSSGFYWLIVFLSNKARDAETKAHSK